MNNDIFMTPKELLRSLKIYRSVIKKQIRYIPFGFTDVRKDTKKLIDTLDYYIKDYEDFITKQKIKSDIKQMSLF